MKRFLQSLALILPVLLVLSCTKKTGADEKPVKDIVIIHSYPQGEWYHGINAGLEEELKKKGIKFNLQAIVFHAEFWKEKDAARRTIEKNRILEFVKSKSPDLVLMCDDEASDFIAGDLAQSGFPVIFTGINRKEKDIPWLRQFSRAKIAGTLELTKTEDSIRLIQKLRPTIKRISILTSANDTSDLVVKQISEDMKKLKTKLKVELGSVHKLKYWSQWKKSLPEINAKSDAVWILVPYDVRNANNQELPIEHIGSYLKQNLRIPSLGIISISTKIGVLAAIPASPSALGRQMGEQASDFFKGKSLAEMGVVQAKYFKEEINYSEAARLGISIPKTVAARAFLVREARLKFGR